MAKACKLSLLSRPLSSHALHPSARPAHLQPPAACRSAVLGTARCAGRRGAGVQHRPLPGPVPGAPGLEAGGAGSARRAHHCSGHKGESATPPKEQVPPSPPLPAAGLPCWRLAARAGQAHPLSCTCTCVHPAQTHTGTTHAATPLQIFWLDAEKGTRGTASGTAYVEDESWAGILDEGWALEIVRQTGQVRQAEWRTWAGGPGGAGANVPLLSQLMQLGVGRAGGRCLRICLNSSRSPMATPTLTPTPVQDLVNDMRDPSDGSATVHWLDYGDEHPHRIALSVKADSVPSVVEALKKALEAGGVQAQVAAPPPSPLPSCISNPSNHSGHACKGTWHAWDAWDPPLRHPRTTACHLTALFTWAAGGSQRVA